VDTEPTGQPELVPLAGIIAGTGTSSCYYRYRCPFSGNSPPGRPGKGREKRERGKREEGREKRERGEREEDRWKRIGSSLRTNCHWNFDVAARRTEEGAYADPPPLGTEAAGRRSARRRQAAAEQARGNEDARR
jgi:hypothetical protein